LSERLGLIGPIVEKVLNFMRREAKVEVKPRLEGNASLPYALTERGRSSALDALMRSGYVGPAPVPLEDYVTLVQAQTVHARKVNRASLDKAFEGMFMPKNAADQFGISVNSGRPVFIYGPAGTGKTYVTHRLSRLFRDVVLIPHAIAIDETIVQVFDPLLHKAVRVGDRQSIMLQHGHDARYVACERPVIVTGGAVSTRRRCSSRPTTACSSSTTSAGKRLRPTRC
jgi:predicted ATPase with chaperone activity